MHWSLLGEINEFELKKEMDSFLNEYNSEENKNKIKTQLKFYKYASIILIIFTFLGFYFLKIMVSRLLIIFIGLCVGLCVLFISFYFLTKQKQTDDLIDYLKLNSAKEKGWLYSYKTNYSDCNRLLARVPKIFAKGNTLYRYVKDQFYGNLIVDGKKVPFHLGDFFYQVSSGSGKNKNVNDYTKHFFAFKNPKVLKESFLITPEKISDKLKNFFIKKDVNLESNEFNKKFYFDYSGDSKKIKAFIAKIMTPSTQLKLLDLVDKNKKLIVLFEKEFTIFLFDGFLLKNQKAFSSMELNSFFIENLEQELLECCKILK
jgi:hypothetical protein